MAKEQSESTSEPKVITVSPEQLKQMIADGVLECMSTLKPELEEKSNDVDYDRLAGIIGDAVAAGIGKNTRPKVSIGQYVQRGFSVFHPKPAAQTEKMTRKYFQNGVPINFDRAHDSEVALLNKITHSGRYINRLVEVVVGFDGPDEVVHIRFNNKHVEQQFELKGHAKDFTDMLRQIVEEQQKEDAEDAEFEAKFGKVPSRHFSTKATREARARVGV